MKHREGHVVVVHHARFDSRRRSHFVNPAIDLGSQQSRETKSQLDQEQYWPVEGSMNPRRAEMVENRSMKTVIHSEFETMYTKQPSKYHKFEYQIPRIQPPP